MRTKKIIVYLVFIIASFSYTVGAQDYDENDNGDCKDNGTGFCDEQKLDEVILPPPPPLDPCRGLSDCECYGDCGGPIDPEKHPDKDKENELNCETNYDPCTCDGIDCEKEKKEKEDKEEEEEEEDLCDYIINNLNDNSNFNNELERLKLLSSQDTEYGGINPSSINPMEITGSAPDLFGRSSIDLLGFLSSNNVTEIDGFIHTHSPNGSSIFSVDDMVVLGYLAENDFISDSETFIYTVTTGRGTTYSAIINDIDKLSQFFNENFGTTESWDQASTEFLDDIAGFMKDGIDFVKANELVMLEFIKDAGLDLIKQDQNGAWKELEKNKTDVDLINCNN